MNKKPTKYQRTVRSIAAWVLIAGIAYAALQLFGVLPAWP